MHSCSGEALGLVPHLAIRSDEVEEQVNVFTNTGGTGSLPKGPEAFQRYLRCLEQWSYWHVESGWSETEQGRRTIEYLDWFEALNEGAD